MADKLFVKEIMTANISTLKKEQSVREATKVLAKLNIGAAPVVENGEIIGMFSERDLVNKVVAKDLDLDKALVHEVMTSPVITIDEKEELHQALFVMTEKHIRHLPVVKDGKMVGIVGIRGLLHALLTDTIDSFVTG